MDKEFELSDQTCDKLYNLILAKMANSNRMRVEDISTDVEKHYTLRRSLFRAAYELGKTVADARSSETPNVADKGIARRPSLDMQDSGAPGNSP